MGRYSPEYLTKMTREPMSLSFIKRAIENKSILESQVIGCDENYTLTLNLGRNIIGKIPFTELEYHYDKNETTKIASAVSKVGKHVKYTPISFEKNGEQIIVNCSRRESQRVCFERLIKNLVPGDVIDARIIKVVGYGAFCDIGCGITALLPTNSISVTHVVDPVIALRYVHRIKVVVKDIDENYRIQLSHKELLGNWIEETSRINVGDIMYGTVLSKEDYGIFIRISQNLSGLAEVSNLDINVGDLVSFKILSIIPNNMKVKLLILEKIELSEADMNRPNETNMRFRYIIKDGHINTWNYSTPTAKKQISSEFTYIDRPDAINE